MGKNLKFQKVESPYTGAKDTKAKGKALDDEYHVKTEYVCTKQNKFGVRTYAVRKVFGESSSN